MKQSGLERSKKNTWHWLKKKILRKKVFLRNFLKKNSKKNKSFIVDEISKNAKEAILKYKTVKILKNYLLLDVLLVTGRHHQIRAQFSKLGTPIRGDIKYGAKRPLHDKSISLHSKEIEFEHPVNKEILVLQCDPPDEFIPKFKFKNFYSYFYRLTCDMKKKIS